MYGTPGYQLVAFLDDFLLVSKDYVTCLEGQRVLLKLLRDFGFSIAWPKVEGPCEKLVFLGIEIDTTNMTVGLPRTKVVSLLQELQEFKVKKRASCKQLQRLAGKLNWASQVIIVVEVTYEIFYTQWPLFVCRVTRPVYLNLFIMILNGG